MEYNLAPLPTAPETKKKEPATFPETPFKLKLTTLISDYADHVLAFVKGIEEGRINSLFTKPVSTHDLTGSSKSKFFARAVALDSTGPVASMRAIERMFLDFEKGMEEAHSLAPSETRKNDIVSFDLADEGLNRLGTIAYKSACLQLLEPRVSGQFLYFEYRKLLTSGVQALGADHPLVDWLTEKHLYYGSSQAVRDARVITGLPHGKSKPAYTEKGYELEFRLPVSLIRDDVISSGREFVKYVYKLSREIEQEGKLPVDGPDSFDNVISARSVLNGLARRSPRLYDPNGEYRGRISEHPTMADSIKNPEGEYGDYHSRRSVVNLVDFARPSEESMIYAYGIWTIVSDGV